MITIHEKTVQKFDTLGLGALLPGSCVVTEEVNGAYELKMEHPYDPGEKWKRIERGRIIYASTPTKMQPFRIYNVKPDMGGVVVNARHIFYDLLDNQCSKISFDGAASGALVALQDAFAFPMPFSFETDISVSGVLKTGKMNPVQALLTDDDETTSFVKGFGGELLRDGFNVSLKAAMGQDRDVAIRYGKNLAALDVTEDEADVKTRIMCYGSDGSATVDSLHLNEYVYPKIHTLEDEDKTVAELKAEAQELFDGGADLPLVNIKVDFVVLADTVEYADYAPLEEVFLGDIVTIINQKMNFAKKARVISYEWDCLLEKYNEVELGDFMPTLASSVTSGVRSGSLASSAAVTSSAVAALLNSHMNNFNNPHRVTAAQTGGGSGGSSDADALLELLAEHEENKENPHEVTAEQVGTYTKGEIDELLSNGAGGGGASVLSGVSAPTTALGNNGDIYVQTPDSADGVELEYIESSGTQLIDTLFYPNQNTTVYMKAKLLQETSGDNNQWYKLFGAKASGMFGLWVYKQFSFYYEYGSSKVEQDFGPVEEVEIVASKNKITINGVSMSATTATFATEKTMHLFAYNGDTSAYYKNAVMQLEKFKIYDAGILIRDFVPWMKTDGSVGMKDKLNNVFYGNIGTGTFVAGPAVGKGYVYFKRNGTWVLIA